ncbi:preprotein translocase subunit SecG [Desulfobulbus alkaliphilus]|uniref:preprotein translocase subunit SecG n=1 Tax=Desulfobulbus alkaliphilus TaxID=869814 RepID=UPI00196262E9|nr:preprotein translocase subunit SecG [Desulfobulbus alkaliphilus]MBM9536587.1 preprotein translocase subunit SecG [Desulfobulbus alkaliphilus]
MTTILIAVHVFICFFLIGIVLLQQGKGADVGATFGGSSSQSLFGSEGPVPLLNKITTLAAIIFMLTSVSLAYLASTRSTGTVMGDLRVEQPEEPPAVEEPMPSPVVPLPAPVVPVTPVEPAEGALPDEPTQ